MIVIKNISVTTQSVTTLIINSSFIIKPHTKAALIGNNGTGKTSLLKLILGKSELESGSIEIPKNWKIATIEQELDNINQITLDYLINGDKKYVKAITEYQNALNDNNILMLNKSMENLEIMDAWTIKSRAAIILKGLGFTDKMMNIQVSELSGGWRVRLNLARALIVKSDFLILDEPTNHLDLDAVFWLETYLLKYTGTLLIVSHDQEFLDTVCNQILHIDDHKIITYYSNYSNFIETRAKNIEENNKQYGHQEKKINQLQRFIDRFKAKETKSAQARSKMKAIERLRILSPIIEKTKFNFSFFDINKKGNFLITIKKSNMGYDENNIILKNINITIEHSTKISLLGLNGAGKSTFIKGIANKLPIITGEINKTTSLKIGYLTQHSIDSLNLEENSLWHMQNLYPDITEFGARKFLGRFNFKHEQVYQKIKTLSGGEKSRLMLAIIIYSNPNLLLLDEPTNNLDIDMRNALCQALLQFNGAVILVSHDRHLLKTISDSYYLINDQKLELFNGDLKNYEIWLKNKVKN